VIYGRIASAFGYSWEYIDECVTIPMLAEMQEYWQEIPPLAESLADIRRALGWTPPRGVPAAEDENGHAAFVAELAQMGIAIPPGA
jgi:hypothetical protein